MKPLPKTILIAVSFILPLIILSIVDLGEKIDPMLAYLFLGAGFPVFVLVFKKSLKNVLIPYIMLQLIYFFIFLGNKLPLPIGPFKPYIIVFGMSTLLAGYYILNNFKYLWREFIVFRLLFLFLVFNIPYFLFYHSNFRLSNLTEAYEYANMIEDFKAALTLGFTPVARSFSGSEHKFVIYLGSLSALVGITIPLMLFKKTKSLNEVNSTILTIIKFLLIGFIVHFVGAVLCIALGLSQIAMIGGRLGGDFMGDVGLGFHIYFSIFILLFIGFKIFVDKTEVDPKEKKIINLVLNFFIALSGILVLLHINKTSIILLGLCISLIIIVQGLSTGKKIDFSILISKITGFLKFTIGPTILLLLIAMANMDFVDTVSDRIFDRFSNIDTLNDRFTMWNYFVIDWLSNLNLITFLFGFGIDSSRELAFYITYILAGRDYHTVQIHNIYLDIFHDYGMVALLYVGSFIYIIFNNIKILLSRDNAANLKLFSTISLAIMIFFIIYHATDGMRIPFSIMFFCLLGFLEAVKHAYIRYELKEEK